jgi:hypothetical protein
LNLIFFYLTSFIIELICSLWKLSNYGQFVVIFLDFRWLFEADLSAIKSLKPAKYLSHWMQQKVYYISVLDLILIW